MYAVGARTVSSVTEHVPMLVLSSVGLVLGSELAERTLVNQGRAIAQEDAEIREDVLTATQLVGGAMQAAYDASRVPYARYQAAFMTFIDASTKFLKDQALDGMDGYSARAGDIDAMAAAEKQMREASADYQIACAKLGVQTSARRLDTLSSHIMKGNEEMVATAVTMVLPEVAPGAGEIWKALKVGLGAEARTGMPVKNQQAIADVCKTHDVVIDVRGTNPEAPRRLAEGHLPKPEAIKAKSINELDTYLGFREDDVGLVGYMEPKAPVRSEVPPKLWEQVEKRYAERAAEFKDLAPDMKNLSLPSGGRD